MDESRFGPIRDHADHGSDIVRSVDSRVEDSLGDCLLDRLAHNAERRLPVGRNDDAKVCDTRDQPVLTSARGFDGPGLAPDEAVDR
jgi:hypothetical protein